MDFFMGTVVLDYCVMVTIILEAMTSLTIELVNAFSVKKCKSVYLEAK